MCIIGIAAVVLFPILFGGAIETVYEDIMAELAATGEDFLVAIQSEDYEKAYLLTSSQLRAELGGPEALATIFDQTQVQILGWEYVTQPVQLESGEQGLALDGNMDLSDGTQLEMRIVLATEGEQSRVAGFNFEPQQ